MSQLLGVYLMEILGFRTLINPETTRNGILFGDKKGPWVTDRLSKLLAKESQARLGFRMTIADYRHISVAIDRKFVRGIDLELADDEDEDEAHDLMAAHSTRTALNRYGRQAGLLRRLDAESIEVFRSISDRWQRWLGLVSRIQRQEAEGQEEEVEDESVEMQVQSALERAYGVSAEFRGKQREAVMAVVKGVSPLFICLPTGGGKSLTFMIPCLLKTARTTVVITPLVVLADDLLRRCKEFNIDCFIFGRTAQRMAKVVIIVTETAVRLAFSQFILDIHLSKGLERIVFDEAHKIVTDVNYRPKLEDLKKLALPVQYVFLSATFPPNMRKEFEQAMVVKDMVVIRELAHKRQFKYAVEFYEDDELWESYLEFIEDSIGLCTGTDKVENDCEY